MTTTVLEEKKGCGDVHPTCSTLAPSAATDADGPCGLPWVPSGHTSFSWCVGGTTPPGGGHTAFSWRAQPPYKPGDDGNAAMVSPPSDTASAAATSYHCGSGGCCCGCGAATSVYEPVDLFAPGHVFFINLNRRPDRREELLRHLRLCGIPAEGLSRMPAVDGHTIPEMELPQNQSFGTRWWNRGALGCLRSHLAVLRAARDAGLPYVVVLEDDARFDPVIKSLEAPSSGSSGDSSEGSSVAAVCAHRVRWLPHGWHMLYLGGNFQQQKQQQQGPSTRRSSTRITTTTTPSGGDEGTALPSPRPSLRPVSPGVWRVKRALTTHAYAVHSRAYARLVALLETSSAPVDILYSKYQRKHPCYGLLPPVAVQAAGYSDVFRAAEGRPAKYVDWSACPSLRAMA